MDVNILVALVALVEHCLASYAHGQLRTRGFLSYIKPSRYQTISNSHPDIQTYPVWHGISKKNSGRGRPWTKREPEVYPVAQKTDSRYYANSLKSFDKRFFQFSPFVLERSSKSAPYSDYKSTYVDEGSKPSARVNPFVDHFAGVRSWAIPFYGLKQTVPNPPHTLSLKEKDDMDALAMNRNLDRGEKLSIIKELLQDVADGTKGDEHQTAQNKDHSFTSDTGTNGNVEKEKITPDSHVGTFLSDDRQGDMFSNGISSLPLEEEPAIDTRNSYSHEKDHSPDITDKESAKGLDTFGYVQDESHGSEPDFTDVATADGDQLFSSFSTRSDPDSYYFFDGSISDPGYYDDYGWGNEFGGFVSDDDGCEGIETKTCFSDFDCNCYGLYFCTEGRCQMSDGNPDDGTQPTDPFDEGFWHEGPVDIHA